MDRNIFDNKKETLQQLIIGWYGKLAIGTRDNLAIGDLKQILEYYNYDNRLEMKGLLTRKIIDSLELSYFIGEKFIEFDNSIK